MVKKRMKYFWKYYFFFSFGCLLSEDFAFSDFQENPNQWWSLGRWGCQEEDFLSWPWSGIESEFFNFQTLSVGQHGIIDCGVACSLKEGDCPMFHCDLDTDVCQLVEPVDNSSSWGTKKKTITVYAKPEYVGEDKLRRPSPNAFFDHHSSWWRLG